MALFLTVLSGLAWTIVYAEGIRLGFRDRTYAIPLAALVLNFAWAWVYGIHGLLGPITAQAVINLIWALADVVIVYTFFRFGRAEFPTLTTALFVGWGLLIIGVSFAVQLLLMGEFGVNDAARYSAFLQNLLMSGLFIAMLVARRGLRGQSLIIAVAKWIGTLAPTILFGVIHQSALILGLGLMCSVLDLIYIGLILVTKRSGLGTAEASAHIPLLTRQSPEESRTPPTAGSDLRCARRSPAASSPVSQSGVITNCPAIFTRSAPNSA